MILYYFHFNRCLSRALYAQGDQFARDLVEPRHEFFVACRFWRWFFADECD